MQFKSCCSDGFLNISHFNSLFRSNEQKIALLSQNTNKEVYQDGLALFKQIHALLNCICLGSHQGLIQPKKMLFN